MIFSLEKRADADVTEKHGDQQAERLDQLGNGGLQKKLLDGGREQVAEEKAQKQAKVDGGERRHLFLDDGIVEKNDGDAQKQGKQEEDNGHHDGEAAQNVG